MRNIILTYDTELGSMLLHSVMVVTNDGRPETAQRLANFERKFFVQTVIK